MRYDIRTLLHERRKLKKKTLKTQQTTVITHGDTKHNDDIKTNQSSESKQKSIDKTVFVNQSFLLMLVSEQVTRKTPARGPMSSVIPNWRVLVYLGNYHL